MKGPVGWHPDPAGGNGLRYFDGLRWATHAPPVVAPAPAPISVVVNNTNAMMSPPFVPTHNSGSMTVVHLLLTIFTCGLWLPIWVLCEIIDATSPPKPVPIARPRPLTPAERLDQQHAWYLAGDPRGTYGDYPPPQMPVS